jgi:hypothetical protein
MRLVQLVSALALAGAFSAPAFADVEARISPEFQNKLEEDYGVREADVLKTSLVRQVEAAMARAGHNPARVVVTIEDARPNRPTFEQVSDKPGLDPIRSISTGGAKVSGIAYDASGAEIGSLTYRWYESDINQVVGSTTWTDARWVFSRFARRFADSLS